ncbi:MAG: hypothetical protein RL637_826 [Pseudomonadota bacterium]|jgi:cold shock CspA family protein
MIEHQGKLKQWDDEKGFGFIQIENSQGRDVFLHISEVKNSTRRPMVGDIILYQLSTDAKGKIKATNASIKGASFIRPKTQSNVRVVQENKKSFLGFISRFILVIAVIVIIYSQFQYHPDISSSSIQNSPAQSLPQIQNKSPVNYQCDGRQHCSQMRSCEEATFFIRNCPDTKMDGDGDGIPCEDQLCGH